jgi:hypothetical protein
MGAQGLADAPRVHLMTQPAAASRGRIVVVAGPDGVRKVLAVRRARPRRPDGPGGSCDCITTGVSCRSSAA